MKPESFEISFDHHRLKGDMWDDECRAIVLHGAGQSSRERFSRLRAHLNTRGLPSVGFDFIGHGETGGRLTGSSLSSRTEQATAVIRQTCKEPLTLIAASMGAYTAILLTRVFRVTNLVLLVPAVYTSRAYHLPFGPEFSAAIRTPYSWKDSDAFGILEAFTGNLLVVAAENDSVIPEEVIDMIRQSAVLARSRHVYTVPGSAHLRLFPRDGDFNSVIDLIIGMCAFNGT